MIMLRNPWGSTYYSGDWNYRDSRWTDELVQQVPLNQDPRTSNEVGVFVMPLETFTNKDIDCIYDF